jgi:hypothetical protein
MLHTHRGVNCPNSTFKSTTVDIMKGNLKVKIQLRKFDEEEMETTDKHVCINTQFYHTTHAQFKFRF